MMKITMTDGDTYYVVDPVSEADHMGFVLHNAFAVITRDGQVKKQPTHPLPMLRKLLVEETSSSNMAMHCELLRGGIHYFVPVAAVGELAETPTESNYQKLASATVGRTSIIHKLRFDMAAMLEAYLEEIVKYDA